ncbi:MAG: hypothetical protein ABW165_14485, partial [Candidatus Thiodiazotropha sp.]
YGRRIGDWFRDHASTCIRPDGKPVYQKNRNVFHCYRRTLRTRLHRADIASFTIDQIIGWKNETANESVGVTNYTDNDPMALLLEKLSLVDFREQLSAVKPFPL